MKKVESEIIGFSYSQINFLYWMMKFHIRAYTIRVVDTSDYKAKCSSNPDLSSTKGNRQYRICNCKSAIGERWESSCG